MQNLYKILALKNDKQKKYLQNPRSFGKEIKKTILKLLPDAKVLLFGSVIKGESKPDSDFDVLVITSQKFPDVFARAKIKGEILKHFPDSPLEIHLTNIRQFKEWYSRFIKGDYLEV